MGIGKLTDLNVSSCVEKDVVGLDVTMNDRLSVEMF